MNAKRILLLLIIIFWPAAIVYYFTKKKEIVEIKEKNWLLNHPIVTGVAGFVVLIVMILTLTDGGPVSSEEQGSPIYDLELSVNEVAATFGAGSRLTAVQKDAQYMQYKSKLIKSAIRADEINEASLSLSGDLVVLQKSGIASCTARAFFPESEKSKLLTASSGSTITFVGKLTSVDYGITDCPTFSYARVLDVSSTKGSAQASAEACLQMQAVCTGTGKACDEFYAKCG